MVTFPYVVPVLPVTQNLGTYYVAVLPARVLLETCYSDRLRAIMDKDEAIYKLDGTQRGLDHQRLGAIARYIARSDSAFPNSIILAANFREEDGMVEEKQSKRWLINQDASGGYFLTIPSAERLAAVIDGQHRLFAFALVEDADNSSFPPLDTHLICSILLDLPKPFQAQLFATINSTQKPVDRSQTYELFGYNISEEESDHWSPDKLAVFLSRKLNVEDDSPLKGRIIIAPENDLLIEQNRNEDPKPWKISMATVVDGILRLISSNPKHDTSELLTPTPRPRSALRGSKRSDKSPLRELYLEGNDQLIFMIIRNYLIAVQKVMWSSATEGSFITKTIGVQALLDILRKLCGAAISEKDISVGFFEAQLAGAKGVDFRQEEFRNASGAGRAMIRKFIEARIGIL